MLGAIGMIILLLASVWQYILIIAGIGVVIWVIYTAIRDHQSSDNKTTSSSDKKVAVNNNKQITPTITATPSTTRTSTPATTNTTYNRPDVIDVRGTQSTGFGNYSYNRANIRGIDIPALHSKDIDNIYIPEAIKINSLSTCQYKVTEWRNSYVSYYNEINYGTSIEVKNTYKTIRDAFCRGVYYDLSDAEYCDYAKILYYDIMNAARQGATVNYERIQKIFGAIIRMCPTLDRKLFSLHKTEKNDLIISKALLCSLPNAKDIYSWADFALRELDIPAKDYKLLERVNYVWLSYNLLKSPNVRKLVVTIFLEVMHQERPSNRPSLSYFYNKKADTLYTQSSVYLAVLQLILNVVMQYAKDEPFTFKLESGDYQFENSFKENFPEGMYRCIEKSFEKHLPLSNEAIKEIYCFDNQIWKSKFEKIKEDFKNTRDFEAFINKADQLAEWTSKASNAYMLYAAIIKEISKEHKTKALLYYFRARIVNDKTKLLKASHQHLFPTPELETRFEQLLQAYRDKKITAQDVAAQLLEFYPSERITRRKVTISSEDLKQKEMQFQQTVSLLDNIIGEENEVVEPSDKPQKEIEAIEQTDNNYSEIFDAFTSNKYYLTKEQVQAIAKNQNKMVNVFIDEINEKYYDTLDDNLIEEIEDGYKLESSYLQTILQS